MLHMAEAFGENALQNAELGLIYLPPLVPIQHLPEVSLLALVYHLDPIDRKDTIEVAIHELELVQLLAAIFRRWVTTILVVRAVDHVVPLALEQQVFVLGEGQVHENASALDHLKDIDNIKVYFQFFDPLVDKIVLLTARLLHFLQSALLTATEALEIVLEDAALIVD